MTNHFLAGSRAAALFAMAAASGGTQANLVTNGSFESTTAVITSTMTAVTVTAWANSDIGEAIVLPSWYPSGQIFPNVGFAGAVPQSSPLLFSLPTRPLHPVSKSSANHNPYARRRPIGFHSLAPDS